MKHSEIEIDDGSMFIVGSEIGCVECGEQHLIEVAKRKKVTGQATYYYSCTACDRTVDLVIQVRKSARPKSG